MANENRPYQHLVSADGWYYVQLPSDESPVLVVYPVAVWACTETNDVLGLIPVAGGGPGDRIMGIKARLVEVPPLRGVYKHRDELTELERESLHSGKSIEIPVGERE